MDRNATNFIRTILEDHVPAAWRDSAPFLFVARMVVGKYIDEVATFRRRAVELTDEDYARLYEKHPRIHDESDNSPQCIRRIMADITGTSVLDVGCGTGALLRMIRQGRPELTRCVGVDIVAPQKQPDDNLEFLSARIEQLPFASNEFDTVVCTHTLEHVLDFRGALAELRRVAAKNVIVVVPREREGRYTFNAHLQFFPYKESFLRAASPFAGQYECVDIGRDIYFAETRKHDGR